MLVRSSFRGLSHGPVGRSVRTKLAVLRHDFLARSLSQVVSGRKSGVVKAYPFTQIEKKWQTYWDENKTFRTPGQFRNSGNVRGI